MTSGPAAPAALNGQSSLSDSLQNSSVRHGTDIIINIPGNRDVTGDRGFTGSCGEDREERERPQHQHHHTFVFLHKTGRRECAHRVAGVCACVCPPVWITMMQSAAVLPTESPVKSLPEILGVPLQRKTFSLSLSIINVETRLARATCAAGFHCRDREV